MLVRAASLSLNAMGIVTLRWGTSGIPATSSGMTVEDGRESLLNAERRRFLGSDEPLSSAALESGVLRKLEGIGSEGISGMDSPSETANELGRENRRKGEALLFGGVSPPIG